MEGSWMSTGTVPPADRSAVSDSSWIRSAQPAIDPDMPDLEPMEGEEAPKPNFTAAARRVMGLYNHEISEAEFEKILNLYVEDAIFEDPLIRVKGKGPIRQQFWAVRNLLIGEVLQNRVFEECPITTSKGDVKRYAIEALVRYRVLSCVPKRFGFTIKQTTILQLEAKGGSARIQRHEDYWSLFESISALPYLGDAYAFSKTAVGAVSTVLFRITFSCCKRSS
mmetsp:Transcript_5468/g.10723  ORF Transcript_5468/g.10723 Transcript_5468/m.10723 type:complete len:223 (+) Transcript_5468:138-806(+)|eukprot:CAMPEP_0167802832 /NCGR_PEP_ID=MMETSP0111_2-20121227/19383_1 /TAXON_ID=91324 /ORGANISM="Lotharella globosa, Strain CCCM811" /LENGTH=222 /DNA_ID=CAMNT_0007699001 /DNA_START=115 /DNA_END=783 /DNA_ORIENTATION=+